jgi:hypothetical protein
MAGENGEIVSASATSMAAESKRRKAGVNEMAAAKRRQSISASPMAALNVEWRNQ